MELNDDLMRLAELKADGKNVHAVRDLLSIYRGYGVTPDSPINRRAMEETERRIRVFISSGEIIHTNHPFPITPNRVRIRNLPFRPLPRA